MVSALSPQFFAREVFINPDRAACGADWQLKRNERRRKVTQGGLTRQRLWHAHIDCADIAGEHTWEECWLLVENKYTAIAAVVGFLLALWLTDGSMIAAFGVLALIAGAGWAVRRLLS